MRDHAAPTASPSAPPSARARTANRSCPRGHERARPAARCASRPAHRPSRGPRNRRRSSSRARAGRRRRAAARTWARSFAHDRPGATMARDKATRATSSRSGAHVARPERFGCLEFLPRVRDFGLDRGRLRRHPAAHGAECGFVGLARHPCGQPSPQPRRRASGRARLAAATMPSGRRDCASSGPAARRTRRRSAAFSRQFAPRGAPRRLRARARRRAREASRAGARGVFRRTFAPTRASGSCAPKCGVAQKAPIDSTRRWKRGEATASRAALRAWLR